jgi:hypothetical protein
MKKKIQIKKRKNGPRVKDKGSSRHRLPWRGRLMRQSDGVARASRNEFGNKMSRHVKLGSTVSAREILKCSIALLANAKEWMEV